MKHKMKGEYKLVITSPDGTQRDTGWFDNIILNQGMDFFSIESDTYIFTFGAVGTGTSAPNPAQTELEDEIARATGPFGNDLVRSYVNGGADEGYVGKHTYTINFAQGAVVGNITEVGTGGFGYDFPNSLFVSRALIVDGGGTPISIAVTSFDQLTMYYRLNIFPVITDSTSTVTINSVDYTCTTRLLRANNACQFYSAAYNLNLTGYADDFELADITADIPIGTNVSLSPSGTYVTPSSPPVYVPGTSELNVNFTIPANAGNTPSGLQGFMFLNGLNTYQIGLSAPIPKTNTETLSLDFRLSWARP